MRRWGRSSWRGDLGPSILAGLLVALLVGAGAALFASSRPTGYEAEARLVVLPREDLDPAEMTAYYETLSRGQIIGTFAEVLQLDRFAAAAAAELDLPDEQRVGVDVDAAVIPDSSMISLTVTAADPRTAEGLTGAIVEESSDYVGELAEGYALELVSSAVGTATPSGLSALPYTLVMGVAALTAGVATQQVVLQLLLALDRRAQLSVSPVLDRRPGSGASDDDGPGLPYAGTPGPRRQWMFLSEQASRSEERR